MASRTQPVRSGTGTRFRRTAPAARYAFGGRRKICVPTAHRRPVRAAQYPVRNAPSLALRSRNRDRAGLLRNSRSPRCAASPNTCALRTAHRVRVPAGRCAAAGRNPGTGRTAHQAAGRRNHSAQLLSDHMPVSAQCRSAEADLLQHERYSQPGVVTRTAAAPDWAPARPAPLPDAARSASGGLPVGQRRAGTDHWSGPASHSERGRPALPRLRCRAVLRRMR